ncbi:MAG: hypothetical protein WC870_02880 [Candidatus Paceibacterota bacterium]
MHNMDLPDEAVIAKIQTVIGEYDTSIEALKALKSAGISNEIITEMLKSQQKLASPAISEIPETQTDPNDPMAGYNPGVYIMGDDGKLAKLEPGKLTRKEKAPNLAVLALTPFSVGDGETCYFNNVKPPVVTSHRPSFTFYISQTRFASNIENEEFRQLADLPLQNLAVVKLEKENDRIIFKYKYREKLIKRLIRLKVEEVYKDVYKVTLESDLPDGNYALGSFDFDMASSSGIFVTSSKDVINTTFSLCLLPFTIQGGEITNK